LTTRWVPSKGFRSSHPPFPSFSWRTQAQPDARSGARPPQPLTRIRFSV
jgi:hypothetical protein